MRSGALPLLIAPAMFVVSAAAAPHVTLFVTADDQPFGFSNCQADGQSIAIPTSADAVTGLLECGSDGRCLQVWAEVSGGTVGDAILGLTVNATFVGSTATVPLADADHLNFNWYNSDAAERWSAISAADSANFTGIAALESGLRFGLASDDPLGAYFDAGGETRWVFLVGSMELPSCTDGSLTLSLPWVYLDSEAIASTANAQVEIVQGQAAAESGAPAPGPAMGLEPLALAESSSMGGGGGAMMASVGPIELELYFTDANQPYGLNDPALILEPTDPNGSYDRVTRLPATPLTPDAVGTDRTTPADLLTYFGITLPGDSSYDVSNFPTTANKITGPIDPNGAATTLYLWAEVRNGDPGDGLYNLEIECEFAGLTDWGGAAKDSDLDYAWYVLDDRGLTSRYRWDPSTGGDFSSDRLNGFAAFGPEGLPLDTTYAPALRQRTGDPNDPNNPTPYAWTFLIGAVQVPQGFSGTLQAKVDAPIAWQSERETTHVDALATFSGLGGPLPPGRSLEGFSPDAGKARHKSFVGSDYLAPGIKVSGDVAYTATDGPDPGLLVLLGANFGRPFRILLPAVNQFQLSYNASQLTIYDVLQGQVINPLTYVSIGSAYPFNNPDTDLDVDQADFAKFQACFSGDDGGVGAGCGTFNNLGDLDIDLDDYRFIEADIGGPDLYPFEAFVEGLQLSSAPADAVVAVIADADGVPGDELVGRVDMTVFNIGLNTSDDDVSPYDPMIRTIPLGAELTVSFQPAVAPLIFDSTTTLDFTAAWVDQVGAFGDFVFAWAGPDFTSLSPGSVSFLLGSGQFTMPDGFGTSVLALLGAFGQFEGTLDIGFGGSATASIPIAFAPTTPAAQLTEVDYPGYYPDGVPVPSVGTELITPKVRIFNAGSNPADIDENFLFSDTKTHASIVLRMPKNPSSIASAPDHIYVDMLSLTPDFAFIVGQANAIQLDKQTINTDPEDIIYVNDLTVPIVFTQFDYSSSGYLRVIPLRVVDGGVISILPNLAP